jgi:hypothetical protein
MPTIGAEPAPILRLAALAAAALALGAGPSPAGGGSAPSSTRAMAVTVDDLPALPSSDGAWRTPDEYVGPRGPSWLYRFRVAKGLPLGLEREPDPPKWVLDLYREAR